MKKAVLFFLVIISTSHFLNAQTCTPANSPNLGEDKTVFVTCFKDVADLTGLYNTNGLTLQWDIANPATAPIGYHWLIATNSSGCKDTAYINVKQDVKKWLGAADSNWHNPANWSDNSVPTDKTHILIFGGTPYPCVISSKDALAVSVRVLSGGAYKVINNRKINITATCDTLPPYYETGTKTILIDNPTSQIIQSVDSDKVVFNSNTAQLLNLDTSNIIVSGIATNAPYGFLRKVKAIQKVGNVYTVTTDDVALETAFKEFFFSYSQLYNNPDTLQHRSADISDQSSFSIGLNYQLASGVNASGVMKVTPNLTFLLDIENFELKYAKIEGSFDRVTTLGLDVNAVSNLSYETTIYNRVLRPFYIPYTPFIVVPILRVKLGASGSSSVAFNASVTNTFEGSAFLEYQNSNWHNGYTSATDNTYNFTGINGDAEVKLYAEPSIDFKLYNQRAAKGTLSAQLYLNSKANTLPKPGCKLSAGVSAGVAANLKMFGINFLDVSYPEIFKYEKVLFECFKPKVTTNPFNSQCDSVATANITHTGSSAIKARGFCWSMFPNPTVFIYKKEQEVASTDATKGLGVYQDTLTNLTPNKVYYLRAYAINNTDTAYGDEIKFTAPVQIGDTLEGGIVFYLDSTCHHGLVCALYDLSNNSIYSESYKGSTGLYLDTAFGSGKKNTDTISAIMGTIYNVASLCHNYVNGGYSDWFLPSLGELNQLYKNKDFIKSISLLKFWSSSAWHINGIFPAVAWVVDFLTGVAYLADNFQNIELNSARAVRKF